MSLSLATSIGFLSLFLPELDSKVQLCNLDQSFVSEQEKQLDFR